MSRASRRPPPPSVNEAVGAVTRAWAGLEMALTVILGELMEVKPDTAMVISAALDYRHRRDLILSLAEFKLQGHPIAPNLTAFMGAVRGMNKERNDAVHAIWTNHPKTGKLTRITMRNRGVYEMQLRPINTRHLVTINRKIVNLCNEGFRMAPELREAVRTWREKWPLLDWPLPGSNEAHRLEAILDKPSDPP
jgi:hypothetical protein